MSKRSELVLPPGTFAYSLDRANAKMSVLVGPIQSRLEDMEGTVVFDTSKGKTVGCPVDRAVQPILIVPVNHYAIMRNPYQDPAGQLIQPRTKHKTLVDEISLSYGETINVPGPTAIVPWPGQQVTVREGHWLTRNQYMTVKLTDPIPEDTWARLIRLDPTLREGEDMAMAVGKRLTIAGTRTSLFIPPTGVHVINDDGPSKQSAVPLSDLSWCCFVTEDGTKRYVRGPGLIFPRADETMVGHDVAYNLYECGVHVRTIGDVEIADGTERFYTRFGQEVTEPVFYWPNVEEEILAVVKPITILNGAGVYVQNRKDADAPIEIFSQPCRWLPNPLDIKLVTRGPNYYTTTVNVDDNEAVEIVSLSGSRVVVGPKHVLLQYDESRGDRVKIVQSPQELSMQGVTLDGIGVKANLHYTCVMVGDPSDWFRKTSGRHQIGQVLTRRFVAAVSAVSSDELDGRESCLIDQMAGGSSDTDSSPSLTIGHDTLIRDLQFGNIECTDKDLAARLAKKKRDATITVISKVQRAIEKDAATSEHEHEAAMQELRRQKTEAAAQAVMTAGAFAARREIEELNQRRAQQDLLNELNEYELARAGKRDSQRIVTKTEEQALEKDLIDARATANVRVLAAVQPELIAAIRAAGAQTNFSKVVQHLGPSAILQGVGLQDAVKRMVGDDAAKSLFLTDIPGSDKPNGRNVPSSADGSVAGNPEAGAF